MSVNSNLYSFKVDSSKTDLDFYYEDIEISKREYTKNEYCMPTYNKGSNEIGVLLIHGFTASPHEMVDIASRLQEKGYSTYSVRVAGHGTSIEDLMTKSYIDWYESCRLGYSALKVSCEKVYILGESNGGLIASAVAAFNDCDALVMSAPAFKVRSFLFNFVPFFRHFKKRWNHGMISSEYADYCYLSFPVEALYQMKLLQNEAKSYTLNISVPTYIAISRKDVLLSSDYAKKTLDNMKSTRKDFILYDNNIYGYDISHMLLTEDFPMVLDGFMEWIEALSK